MLKLLWAEISYNKQHLLTLFGLVVMLTAYNSYRPDSPNILILFLTFITVNNLNVFRNKEKRDRYFALIPVNMTAIGLLRISLLLIPFLGVVIYSLVSNYLISGHNLNTGSLVSFSGLIITVYCVVYILRDRMIETMRRYGLTKRRAIIILFAVVFILNIFTFFAIFESTRHLFRPIEKVIVFVENLVYKNPLESTSALVYGAVCLFALVSSTIVTLNFRKNFLD